MYSYSKCTDFPIFDTGYLLRHRLLLSLLTQATAGFKVSLDGCNISFIFRFHTNNLRSAY